MTHLRRLLLPAILLVASACAVAQPTATARFSLDATTAQAGEVVKGTLTVNIPGGHHAYSNPPTSPDYLPLAITGTAGGELVRASYPRGQMKVFPNISPEPAGVYEGTVRVPVELRLPADASGSHSIRLTVRVQMCDDYVCYMPEELTVSGTVTVQRQTAPPPQPPPDQTTPPRPDPPTPDPTRDDPPAPDDPADGDTPALDEPDEDETEQILPPMGSTDYPSRATEVPLGQEDAAAGAFVFLLAFAFLAGLGLNLTPCVYPLIPITLSFFSSQAAGQSGGTGAKLGLGSMYALGIALSFGILGAITSLFGAGLGELSQSPYFNAAIAAILVGLSLSMFGLYEIRLPGFIQKQLKGRSGGVGAFIMGALLGLAAAPCGTALIVYFITEVARVGTLQFGITIFVAIGLGLGLPYVFLAAAGAKLPRSADWLVSVKRILGVVVVLLAFDRFLGPALTGYGVRPEVVLGINVSAFLLAAAYLVFFDRSFSSKIVAAMRTVTVLGAAVYGMMLYHDLDGMLRENRFRALEAQLEQQVDRTIAWQPFTIEAFEQAVGNGKPVIVDGTANWCAACQEIEHKTLSDPRVIVSMRDVVAFKMDASTGVPKDYVAATQEHFGWRSLPHIRFYNADGQLIHIQNQFINVDDWLDVLDKAGASVLR